jgi:hypothetical protein
LKSASTGQILYPCRVEVLKTNSLALQSLG